MLKDRYFMGLAINEAKKSIAHGDVPVGCVIVKDGLVIARAHNQREELGDPIAHAELIALRHAAASLSTWRLDECTVYVTLEPCPMCAGALVQARVARLVFGARDFKLGAAGTIFNLVNDPRIPHRIEVTDSICEDECRLLLSSFFSEKR